MAANPQNKEFQVTREQAINEFNNRYKLNYHTPYLQYAHEALPETEAKALFDFFQKLINELALEPALAEQRFAWIIRALNTEMLSEAQKIACMRAFFAKPPAFSHPPSFFGTLIFPAKDWDAGHILNFIQLAMQHLGVDRTIHWLGDEEHLSIKQIVSSLRELKNWADNTWVDALFTFLSLEKNKPFVNQFLAEKARDIGFFSATFIRKLIAYGFSMPNANDARIPICREFSLSLEPTSENLDETRVLCSHQQLKEAFQKKLHFTYEDKQKFIDSSAALEESKLWAAIHSHCPIAFISQWISGVDVNDLHVDTGMTPLMFAVREKNEALVKLLLRHPKIDPLKKDTLGKNALGYLPKPISIKSLDSKSSCQEKENKEDSELIDRIKDKIIAAFKSSDAEIKTLSDDFCAIYDELGSSSQESELALDVATYGLVIIQQLLENPNMSLNQLISRNRFSLDEQDRQVASMLSAHLAKKPCNASSNTSVSLSTSANLSASSSLSASHISTATRTSTQNPEQTLLRFSSSSSLSSSLSASPSSLVLSVKDQEEKYSR